jgi:hypothetical protein
VPGQVVERLPVTLGELPRPLLGPGSIRALWAQHERAVVALLGNDVGAGDLRLGQGHPHRCLLRVVGCGIPAALPRHGSSRAARWSHATRLSAGFPAGLRRRDRDLHRGHLGALGKRLTLVAAPFERQLEGLGHVCLGLVERPALADRLRHLGEPRAQIQPSSPDVSTAL